MQQPTAVRCVQQDIWIWQRRLQRELRIANEDLWFLRGSRETGGGGCMREVKELSDVFLQH